MTFSPGIIGYSTGANPYDPDAQAFFTAIDNAGGSTTTTEKGAVNQRVLDMKADGAWNVNTFYYPFVGGSAISCSFNLFNPATYQITWIGSPTFTSSGVLFNGSGQYGKTGFISNGVISSENTQSITEYCNTNNTDVTIDSYDLGAGNQASFLPPYTLISSSNSGNTKFVDILGTTLNPGQDFRFNRTTPVGSLIGTRSGTDIFLYLNGLLYAQSTNTGTGLADAEWYVGSINLQNGAYTSAYSAQNLCSAGGGETLTAAQVAQEYVSEQIMQTTLGRQVGVPISNTDADAKNYITAAGLSGRIDQLAVFQLFSYLKNYSIYTSLLALYPMMGATSGTCAINAITPGTFNISWVGSPTFTATGVGFNGVNQYGDTNINSNTSLSVNTGGLAYYSRSNVNLTEEEFGNYDSSGSGLLDLLILKILAAGSIGVIYMADVAAATVPAPTPATTLGLFSGFRTGATATAFYQNSSQLATATPTATAHPNGNIYLGVRNDIVSGIPFGYTTKECALGAVFSTGLSSGDNNLWSGSVKIFQTVLNRQV